MSMTTRLLGSAAALAIAAPAIASPLPPVVFSFQATNSDGLTGSYDVLLTDPSVFFLSSDIIYWGSTADIDVMDSSGSTVLATIESGTVVSMGVGFHPGFGTTVGFIDMSFSMVADANFDTTISVSSGELTNIGFTSADIQVDGGITMSDSNSNGATATGLNSGNFLNSGVNGGTFANLIDGTAGVLSAAPDGSNTDDETLPTIFHGAVNSLSLSFDLELSAGDQFGGTASVVTIPAPGAMALLGLGGLAAARRRR